MLSLYATLPGIAESGGIPRIVGRIRPLEDPGSFPKIRDLDFLRTAYPDLRFKISLTGPTTFLLACAAKGAGPAYRGPLDSALHDDLTEALRAIAHEVGHRGAFLQLDEPILSQGMRDYAPALRRLDLIASEVPRERTSLHVCGGLVRARTLEALFKLERVSTLSLAFAGRAENENRFLLGRRPWADRDLLLGAGCIDVQVSHRDEVMRPAAVASLLKDLTHRVGNERVGFVLPDCGFRGTPPSLVPALLESLVQGFADAFPQEP
jgi:methionine synthase II (cobalamin-independent)